MTKSNFHEDGYNIIIFNNFKYILHEFQKNNSFLI